MANATFSLGTATFTAPTQVEADAKREANLIDFCKYHGLDIYVNGSQTIDPAKVSPAIRTHLLAMCRRDIRLWRRQQRALEQDALPDDF